MICFGLSSCSSAYLSPSVRVQNASPDGSEIRNIEVVWNGYRLLKTTGPKKVCFGMDEQNFALRKRSDFFGPVHAEWENAEGEKISKDFVFSRSDFPTLKRFPRLFGPHVYRYVILFFTQSDVEYYTSDNPNIKEIEWEKSGNWINKWFEEEGVRRCVNDPEEVKRLRNQFKN